MALVPCRECGKEVSEEAKVCPNCGVKTPSKKRHQRGLYIMIAVLLTFVGGAAYGYYRVTAPPDAPAGKNIAAPAKIQKDVPVKEQILQKDYKEKVGELLDSGKSVHEISKETGLKGKEIRKIKKEKKHSE